MSDNLSGTHGLGLLQKLINGLQLRLQAGERLWKLYFLRPARGRDQRVEHHIYTKEQADGRITLVSYNLHCTDGGQPVISGLARAKDIPKEALNQVIWNVVRKSQIGPDELEVVDLSDLATVDEQVQRLRAWRQANGEQG